VIPFLSIRVKRTWNHLLILEALTRWRGLPSERPAELEQLYADDVRLVGVQFEKAPRTNPLK
jgi:hypothetical protein